jgi:hypothetical protein
MHDRGRGGLHEVAADARKNQRPNPRPINPRARNRLLAGLDGHGAGPRSGREMAALPDAGHQLDAPHMKTQPLVARRQAPLEFKAGHDTFRQNVGDSFYMNLPKAHKPSRLPRAGFKRNENLEFFRNS